MLKRSLLRFRAWRRRLQWPLSWRGFYKPAPVPAFEIESEPPQPVADWKQALRAEPAVAVAQPLPAPVAVYDPHPPVEEAEYGAVGMDLVAHLPAGTRVESHALTRIYAGYDQPVTGVLLIEGGFGQQLTIHGKRHMTWVKPALLGAGRAVTIRLAGRPGARGFLQVEGCTQVLEGYADAQD